MGAQGLPIRTLKLRIFGAVFASWRDAFARFIGIARHRTSKHVKLARFVCLLHRCYKTLNASGKLISILLLINVPERSGAFGSEAVCVLGCCRGLGTDEPEHVLRVSEALAWKT